MNKLLFLLRIQVISFFRLNKMNFSGNSKERKRSILFLLSLLLGFILIESYFCSMVYGWILMGITLSIPSLLVFLTGMICFMLTFMKSSGLLFNFNDFDLLIALPISPRLLLLSRYLFVYLMNLGIACLSFFIPMIVFWIQSYFSLLSLIITLGVTILLPILPIIVANLIDLLLSYLASYFRHTNLVIILFNFLLISLLMLGAIFLNSNSFSQLKEDFTRIINESIPLAYFLQTTIIQSNWFNFIIMASISLISGYIFMLGLGKWYLALNSRFSAKQVSTKFQWKPTQKKTPLFALYKREWALYLSSPIYVINTAFGSLLLLVTSLLLLFFPINKLEKMLEITNLVKLIQPYLFILPVILSAFLVLSTTTASTISIEGKSRWQLSILPISLTKIYQAKLLLQLTITLPVILVSGLCLMISLSLSGIWFIFLLLIPIASVLYCGLSGLLINCCYPIFNWTSEQQVVKQSLAILLTLCSTIFMLIFSVSFIIFLPFSKILGLSLLTLILLVSSLLLYHRVLTKNPFLF
ncbi:hypothetical protein ACYSNW_14460 [Enterococcus sp. LJL99]